MLTFLFFSLPVVASSPSSITNPQSVLSIFLSLLVVIGIIFAFAYIMRRFNVTQSHGQLKVVASLSAGAREKIMVIQVGDEQHLVGVTAQNINHLSKLEAPLPTKVSDSNNGALFKDKLVKAMASKINPAIKGQQND